MSGRFYTKDTWTGLNDIISHLEGWLTRLSFKGKSDEEEECSSWKSKSNLFF